MSELPKKATKKYTTEEMELRKKGKVVFPSTCQLLMLAGSPVMWDEDKPYAIIPGQEGYLKQLRDLHPDWEVSASYMDMEE